MPQYLVAIQHPENYDPSLEGEAMLRDISEAREEIQRTIDMTKNLREQKLLANRLKRLEK